MLVNHPVYAEDTSDLFVSKSGIDSGDCSSSPCLTIEYALDQAQSGDSIHVSEGTYNVNLSITKDITIAGQGMSQTLLDGSQSGRVINIAAGINVSFIDLAIVNGDTTGIALDNDGGGIYNLGTANLLRVRVSDNIGEAGGGIYSEGPLNVSETQIENNRSDGGGGIFLNQTAEASLTLIQSTVANNTGTVYAGGIYFMGDSAGISKIENTTISGNSSNLVGGVMTDSLVHQIEITNSTIANNITTTLPGGIKAGTTVSVKNSIIANNSPNNCDPDLTLNSAGNNLESAEECQFTGDGDLQNSDPLLGALSDNGGPTSTMALLPGSPAIDAGSNIDCPVTDQRGIARPFGQSCDIGAFEYQVEPGAFIKVNPSTGTTGNLLNLTLSWATSTNADSYEFCYDTTDDGTCTEWINTGTLNSADLSNLLPGTTYYWQARANNTFSTTYADGSETSFWSFQTGFSPGSFVKSSPLDQADNQQTNTVLSWNVSDGATSYQYCYDTTDDDDCSPWQDNGTNTSVSLSELMLDTTYFWQVRAVNSYYNTYANGSEIDFWSFSTGNIPEVFNKTSPLNSAIDQPINISLTWAASPDATTYFYCYDTTDDSDCSEWVDNGTETSITISGLAEETTYYWQVKAVNAFGDMYADGSGTAFWSFATGSVPASFGKTAPNNSHTDQPLELTLSWGTSSNASSYEYCYDTTDNNACSTWIDNSAETTATVNGLIPGTTYYWQVRASNSAGTTYADGSFEEDWSFTTGAEPSEFEKSVPVDQTTAQSTELTLTWQPSSEGSTYLYCYDTTDDNDCAAWVDNGTATSVTISALDPNTTYFWQVKAVNAFGSVLSNASTWWSFTTINFSPAIEQKLATNKVTFDWDDIPGATQYKIQLSTSSTFNTVVFTKTLTTSSFTYTTALINRKTYYWRVQPYVNGAWGSWYPTWMFYSLNPPLAPTLANPASGTYFNIKTPELSWNPVANALKYEILLDNSTYFTSPEYSIIVDGSSTIPNVHTIQTTSEFDGLKDGKYYWKVRGVDIIDTVNVPGAWSAYRSFIVDTTPPAVPSLYSPANLAIVRGTPTYSWLAVSGANAYELRYDVDDNVETDPIYNSPILTVRSFKPPLQAIGTYFWQVRARDTAGNWGNWSAARQIEIKPVIPVRPVLVTPLSGAFTNDPTPLLTWNPVPDGITYQVQVSKVYTFSSTVIDTTLEAGAVTIELPVLADAKYFWRVRAINILGELGKWSAYRAYTVDTTPQVEPKLYTPADKVFTYDTTPTLKVTAVGGAKRYRFQVADDPDFTNILLDQTVASTAYTIPAADALDYREGYSWRAKSIDAAGNESLAWSIPRSFTVTFQKAPAYGAITTDTTPIFTWYAVSGATGYKLEVISELNPGEQAYESPVLGLVTSHTVPLGSELLHNKYLWRIYVYTKISPEGLATPWRPLTVTPTTLAAPALNSPANGSYTADNTPDLGWNPVGGALKYEILIDNSIYFNSPDYKGFTSSAETTHTISSNLADGKYYWKVRTVNYLEAPGAWSPYRSFIVDTLAPLAPKLSAPAEAAILRGTPKYSWLAAAGAKYYQFQYAPSSDFSDVQYTSPELTVLYHTPPVQEPGIFYWRVKAKDLAGNWGSWSVVRSITIKPLIPVAPVLTSPASAGTVTVFNPPLTWNAVPYAVNYEIQIDDTSTLTSPVLTATTSELSYTPAFLVNKTYYWRVRAINSVPENGAWSSIRSFKVNAPLDTDLPTDPTGLTSTSHALDVFSTNPQIVMTWNEDASDGTGAGLSGYSYEWSRDAASQADTTIDLGTDVLTTTSPSLEDGTWYFLLRTCDLAGNCSAGITAGPYKVDHNPPSNPTTLSSASHEINIPSNAAFVAAEWGSDADDGDGAGVSGFSTLWDNSPATEPDVNVERSDFELAETSFSLSDGEWYFHLRTCDLMGQCTGAMHIGPFLIDTQSPTNPSSITSSSHVTSETNLTDNTIDMTWSNDASDSGLAGLEGYSFTWDNIAETTPDDVVELPAGNNTATSTVLENGTWYFHFRTCDSAGNCSEAVHTGPYVIDLLDSIPPTNPLTIISTSHSINVFSNDTTIEMSWSDDAGDTGGSGMAGYSTAWDQVADTLPDTVVDHTTDILVETSPELTEGTWYFHLRTCDGDGNCTEAVHSGPYKLDLTAPTNASTVSSTSHTIGGTSTTDSTIDMTWSSDASDGSGSGVAGVSVAWDQAADTVPDNTVDHAVTVHAATSPALSNGTWYYHLRTCDLAGNCSDTKHIGPFNLNLPVNPLCGTISSDATWGAATYTVTCSLTINSGVTVTMLPGAILKFGSTSYLMTVNGILNVTGSAENPAVFTSLKDDSAGGDTNGDGETTSPAPGDWGGIYVTDTGRVSMDYTDLRYGGYNSTYQANLYLTNNAQATVVNSFIRYSKYNGVRINTTTTGKSTGLFIWNSVIENNLTKGLLINTATTITNSIGITETTIQGNGSNAFETSNVAGLNFNNNQLLNNKGYAAYFTLAGNPVPDLTGVSGSGNSINGVGIAGPFTVSQTLTSLSDLVYVIPSSGWTIYAGVTLTIPAGQVIKANGTSAFIRPNGVLIAQGSEIANVAFTSIKDDSLSGDSNGDGTTAPPAKGDWQGITVPAGGKAVLDYAAVFYAGNTGSAFDALVNVDNGGDLLLNNSILGFSQMYGVKVNGIETQAILNNTITDCTSYGIYYQDDIDSIPLVPVIRNNVINNTYTAVYLGVSTDGITGDKTITNNSGVGSTYNAIQLSGQVVGYTAWSGDNELYYYWSGGSSLQINSELRIDPGAIVKLPKSTIGIAGRLFIIGTTDNPVLITSLNDGEGRTPASGDWYYFSIQDSGSANIDHAIIRYGDDAIRLVSSNSASPELVMNNSRIENSSSGIYIQALSNLHLEGNTFDSNGYYPVQFAYSNSPETAPSVVIRNNVFNNNGGGGIRLARSSSGGILYLREPDISGNTGSGNSNNKITFASVYLLGNTSLSANGLPYSFYATLVPEGNSLTFSAGSIVKLSTSDSGTLVISGQLHLAGTTDAPIVITSIKDDTFGGDSNGDGIATSPASGDWYYFSIQDSGSANIDHAIIRYGDDAIRLVSSSIEYPKLNITNSVVSNSYSGIKIDDFQELKVENTVFLNNRYGIQIEKSNATSHLSTLTLTNNEFYNNSIMSVYMLV